MRIHANIIKVTKNGEIFQRSWMVPNQKYWVEVTFSQALEIASSFSSTWQKRVKWFSDFFMCAPKEYISCKVFFPFAGIQLDCCTSHSAGKKKGSWIFSAMDGWMSAGIDEWMDGWMAGWMQKYKITERHSTHYAMRGCCRWLLHGSGAVLWNHIIMCSARCQLVFLLQIMKAKHKAGAAAANQHCHDLYNCSANNYIKINNAECRVRRADRHNKGLCSVIASVPFCVWFATNVLIYALKKVFNWFNK